MYLVTKPGVVCLPPGFRLSNTWWLSCLLCSVLEDETSVAVVHRQEKYWGVRIISVTKQNRRNIWLPTAYKRRKSYNIANSVVVKCSTLKVFDMISPHESARKESSCSKVPFRTASFRPAKPLTTVDSCFSLYASPLDAGATSINFKQSWSLLPIL